MLKMTVFVFTIVVTAMLDQYFGDSGYLHPQRFIST